MHSLRRFFVSLCTRDDGVSLTEYAVMLAMIVLIAIGAIANAGTSHKAFWLDSAEKIKDISPSGTEL
jgi:Flp pilus assembly pilin Flp